jgi:hypothetical protein
MMIPKIMRAFFFPAALHDSIMDGDEGKCSVCT